MKNLTKILLLALLLSGAAGEKTEIKLYSSEECPAAKAEYKQNCIAQKCQNKEGKEKGACEYGCKNEADSSVQCSRGHIYGPFDTRKPQ